MKTHTLPTYFDTISKLLTVFMSRHRASWRSVKQVLVLGSFLLVMLVSGGCSQPSISSQDSLETFTAYLDEYIPLWMKGSGVPGVSMALVRNGELVWSNAYGTADIEHNQDMTVDAIARAESISKSVTAWGVIRLAEKGLIDLDAPVQMYLTNWEIPGSAFDRQAVTIRMLLSNSAGMPLGTIGEDAEYSPKSELPSLPEYLSKEAHLTQEPGKLFSYSNVGFNILELLIEEVTGQDFAAYMAEEVLLPLGMDNASYTWDESFHPLIPTGYELKGDPVPPYIYPASASGGLFADVEAIAQFVSAGLAAQNKTNNPVLNQESIALLYTPQVEIPGLFGLVADSYGFGHFIENLPDGRQAVWHGGQGHGWMTHFHAVPDSGDGIVILTNSQRSWPLIAKVLTVWARWSGIGSVKFGRITYGVFAMKVLVGMVVLVSLWQIFSLFQGLRSGKRSWAPLSTMSLIPRLLQASFGLAGITALWWSSVQPYLFVTSIFPVTANWAGLSLLGLSLILVVSAFFPRFETGQPNNRSNN